MKKRHKWVLIAFLLFTVILGLLVVSPGTSSTTPAGFSLLSGRRIGIVRIDGIIINADKLTEQLRALCEDNGIAGVVLRINSPGGAVAPAQEIYHEISRFRRTGKPLVASMDNVAASGGYYVACPAHTIFANPGTVTGSIGVVMNVSRVIKLFEKLGIEMETIKAGKFKDIGSPHRRMTPREQDLLQDVLDETHNQFIKDICAARAMDCDSVRALADGRIFTGTQALKMNLVDTLGGFQNALDYCKHLAGLPPDARTFEKKPRKSFFRSILGEDLFGKSRLLEKAFYPGGIYYLYGDM